MNIYDFEKITQITFYIGITIISIGLIFIFSGLIINTTASIPVGLYKLTDKSLEKGDYVIFCPPQNAIFDDAKKRGYIGAGFCTGGYGYLLKKILATKKDTVNVSDEGVIINGKLLALSKPLITDKLGRFLPKYRKEIILKDDEFFLMSDINNISFDGRYFGVINKTFIKGVVYPLLTW